MTVIFSKKCELAIQAVLYLSVKNSDQFYNAKVIARELQVPKEFVAKVLQKLVNAGIVGSRRGKHGGFFLAKSPSKITLLDIVETIDGLEVFEKCVLGFPGCHPENPCPVHEKWGYLREETIKMLSNQNLEELKPTTEEKISSIQKNTIQKSKRKKRKPKTTSKIKKLNI